jgi:hypothetical protein
MWKRILLAELLHTGIRPRVVWLEVPPSAILISAGFFFSMLSVECRVRLRFFCELNVRQVFGDRGRQQPAPVVLFGNYGHAVVTSVQLCLFLEPACGRVLGIPADSFALAFRARIPVEVVVTLRMLFLAPVHGDPIGLHAIVAGQRDRTSHTELAVDD